MLKNIGKNDIIKRNIRKFSLPLQVHNIAAYTVCGIFEGRIISLFVDLNDIDLTVKGFLHIFCHSSRGAAKFEHNAALPDFFQYQACG